MSCAGLVCGLAPQAAEAAVGDGPSPRGRHARRDQISIDPLALLVDKQIAADFSHRFEDGWMLDLTPRYGLGSLGSLPLYTGADLGPSFGVGLGARWFVGEGAAAGLFIGAGGSIDRLFRPRAEFYRTMLRAEAGHQWTFAGRWTLGVSAGAAYSMFSSTLRSQDPSALAAQGAGARGFRPECRLKLGFLL